MSKFLFNGVLLVALVAGIMPVALWPTPVAAQDIHADAIVLVNSDSAYYADFQHYIQPYLDNFGIPYTVHDIASAPVTEEAVNRALIIVGHNGLDEAGAYLDSTEQGYISAAVSAGAGLVNFDSLLADAGYVSRYQYVQDVLDLTYGPDVVASSVEIGEGGGGIRINCWEDDHQDPVLPTTSDVGDLDETDGEWTEFDYSGRPFPSVMAGVDEESLGLPVMRFYASGIPNGEYEVFANLYTSGSGRDARYYYGYTPGDPQAHYVDTVGGAGGSDQHEEYSLGTVNITDGTLDIYVQDADLTGSDDYPFFGWAWVRLVPEGAPPSSLHYITERHEPDETIGLSGGMTVLGMTPPADAEAVATAGGAPFIVVRNYGQGKAVQWGSYAWMSHSVKGPVYGLDDLIWRSLVWAARKPFVMQGTPPLLPFRIDDSSGPFWWAEDAADHGLKPWIGLFYQNIDDTEAAHLSTLVNSGRATASVHAKTGTFFYYNHGCCDFPDDEIAANFAHATAWHADHNIPISKYVLGHYYELGTNVFGGLSDWGVEFIGTQMDPGNGYGAPWVMNGPYRLYEGGGSSSGYPMYYADFITVPGHPEFDGQFFNVVTEIRDNAGYEWYPSNDVNGSIERGVVQTKRAFDSMVLATLFTHEQHIQPISRANWNAILEGVLDGVSSYDPIYVTMDEAAQYVRATYTSDIEQSEFDPHTGVLTTTLTGETDLPTQFYLFTECGLDIFEQRIDVPVFSGSTEIITQLPGELHHIEVSPDAVTLGFGDQQPFVAQGYDINDVPVVCAEYTWDVVNGGGTIDQDGLFTAGTTSGIFVDTVTASDQGITGTATVVVSEVPVDHFAFDPVGDQVTGVPFAITITALDTEGLPVTSYDGTAILTDTTGTILPTVTDPFVNGVWVGEVTIHQAATGVVISAQDVATEGSSNPFTVTDPPPIPTYLVTSDSYTQTAGVPFIVTVSSIETTINLWEDDHQDPVLETFTDAGLFNDGDGEWDEFWWTQRPYPAVFGGMNEAASGDLELMHFYADVPNGTYRVIANLYHSRDWRYYWGYTSDDPRAHSFDVTSGPSGDFAEFDLGTITITNSHFDLYTDYGEDLSGGTSWPYFGWAWIRLVPALPETQINLWEDDHQDPVLTTFTDWRLLNDHDGQWDEFLYTPSRPYPTILAGHNEWENNGLQPMHFFADGIPNGVYEVWANLYTVRATRYYYGFTEAEALAEARWVDIVADTIGEQHTEYSLGAIEIIDGQFDLWAGDGDLLSGTPYFYGWAHVRLVANGMTMSSNSPAMLFDGDSDGTFGEPGDDIGTLIGGAFDIAVRDTTAGSGTVITATDSAGFWGRATYTILPGDLAGVEVEPPAVTLPPQSQQQFTATGLDQWSNPIAGLEFDWDVVNGGGTIDEDGLFTAAFTPGVYADTVAATTDSFSGTATVTIELVPADHFTFEFIYEPQYAGVPIEVIITAADDAGDPVTDYNGLPTLSDTTGTIAPTVIGPFTDGVWQGYVTISDVADNVVITADDGVATGSSNPFDVLAMPEHVYSVTSDSYVQVVGNPFAVTVAPISHIIDLWEDAHQRPVLETTTNAGDLITTDGQWTEFHYVSGGRPFPSVMAGADEEDYGLPTMHFYAVGIPNGTYGVIANLYTAGSGRDMRYYYGFTPDDPKALSVDTVGGAGGSDQHEEYSLGEITITDGRFDLYVRDADLLGGTYPIFGWAHVRLEPVFPETRINLWEDDHQDPVLTTTSSVGDLDEYDGEWTEFLYTPSRPYPTILAGVDEEDYGLSVMHFYGDVPNGTYELIANLYTSGAGRDMRYFYGFTPGDPKALYVDTVGGSGRTEQHTEYSLGTVTITDGHFDLYVQDADLLDGTYPFFGWAWVRLVPTRITMSSTSPAMLFDGDGDGTFGEPGDDAHLMTGEPFTTHALDTIPGTDVLITATDDLGGTGVASYTILDLDHIAVTPAEATLDPGATQQFTAQAYDSLDNPIPGLDYTWSVVNGGGAIDVNGLFTADTVAGDYPDTVVAEHAGVQGSASVTVNSGPPVEMAWAPVYGPQYATVPFLADLYALDEYGNVATDYNGTVNVWDTTSTLLPSDITLVDGQWTGELHIDAVADDVIVSADDGTFAADTNPFDVLPAPEQSYAVSSDSYLQTAGVPFTVTVTAISSTINLWEDNHQRPVLETFTDPLLFDQTGGEWDEFDWVNRDYPGVFGGISETLSGALEPMHFYAVVPNGTYRVIANLYRSNDYRYFYGFDPGDMRAYSVDVTTGPSGDFAEFDLGTVTITDYRFNLYTDYAEVIVNRGAFPHFGWAWIRLAPALPETLIDLSEDAHQDPVLTTTTSVAELLAQDGEWAEFLYTPSRPYPSIMAGHDEWENNDLQPMHFFAGGIPNGVYEVWANLYSAAPYHTRYYYGFTEAEALAEARWVDNVPGEGGQEQHAEYSLGTIEITDGRFDLWAGNGDRLDSDTPYVYGWAWIRLVASGTTMSSSSPTMLFDSDGDSVFGEPGDGIGILVAGTFDIAARDTTAGTGVVIMATDTAGNWGAATYTITHATAISIEVTPDPETVTAGESVTYQATAEDAYGNTWDVTAETDFGIEAGAGGAWVDNVYTSELAGDWTVTGEYDGLPGTATLHVEHAAAVSVEIAPTEETVTAGESVTYQITAEDAYSNTWDATAETTFSIEAGAGGTWVGSVYTSEVVGDWTVTGEYDGLTGTATLHVEHATAVSIQVTPDPATVT